MMRLEETYIVIGTLGALGAGHTACHTSKGTQVRHAASTAAHAGHATELGEVDVAEAAGAGVGVTALTTEAAEVVGVVVLTSLILLVLIHPLSSVSRCLSGTGRASAYLVEVGLQEVHLLLALKQAGPELKLKVLLAEDELDLAISVVDLAVLGVNLGEEVQGDTVCNTLLGRALEGNILFGDVKSSFGLGNIGGLDVDVKVVALRLIVGRALGPCH